MVYAKALKSVAEQTKGAAAGAAEFLFCADHACKWSPAKLRSNVQ
jgi:hypothetical protein